jgi:uncharacterized protein YegP (UPF0339 family)
VKFIVYKDDAKEWRWRLRHKNGNILAEGGEGYKNKKGCLKAVERIQNQAAYSEVVESK